MIECNGFLIPDQADIDQHVEAIGRDASLLFAAALTVSPNLALSHPITYLNLVRSGVDRVITGAWEASVLAQVPAVAA